MRCGRIRVFSICLAFTATAVAPARADAFLGAGVGVAKQQLVCAAAAPCDDAAAGLRLFGGYRFNERFGAELTLLRALPEFTASNSITGFSWYGRFEVELVSLTATWNIPLQGVDLQLRAGAAALRGEFRSATVGVPDSSRSEIRPTFGFGLHRALTDGWGVRADLDLTDGQAYTRKGRFSVVSMGVERRF